jgi:hypothetical protein
MAQNYAVSLNTFKKDLANARTRNAVVLGAGASIALTNKPDLSWPGFLLSMIGHALQNGYCTANKKNQLERYKQHLKLSIGTVGPVRGAITLATIADEVDKVYRQRKNERLFEGFLNDVIATLKFDHSSDESKFFLETIARFNCPILTTNYDDMVERGLGIRSLTLHNIACAADVLRNDEQCVIHLHGIYTDPNSIVLTARDYSKLVKDENWEHMVGFLKDRVLIFVGFGSSMFDSAFRIFRQKAFSTGPRTIPYWHWILAEPEFRALEKQIETAQRAGERLPNIVTFKRSAGRSLSYDLCSFLSENIDRPINSAPRRVPIVSHFTTSAGHEIGFTQAADIKLIANKGTWIRKNLARLIEKKIASSGSADVRIILCAPSYANFKAYLEADLDVLKMDYKSFIDEIMDCVSEIAKTKAKHASAKIEVRFSESYHLLRIALFGENAYVTRLSKESSMLLRRNVVRDRGDDNYENEMLAFFNKYFDLLWSAGLKIDLSDLLATGSVRTVRQLDRVYYKMRDRSPGGPP